MKPSQYQLLQETVEAILEKMIALWWLKPVFNHGSIGKKDSLRELIRTEFASMLQRFDRAGEDAPPSTGVTQIERVMIDVRPDGSYLITVTKAFAEEYGGGKQDFIQHGGKSLHYALDVARGMVTLTPATRTETV